MPACSGGDSRDWLLRHTQPGKDARGLINYNPLIGKAEGEHWGSDVCPRHSLPVRESTPIPERATGRGGQSKPEEPVSLIFPTRVAGPVCLLARPRRGKESQRGLGGRSRAPFIARGGGGGALDV